MYRGEDTYCITHIRHTEVNTHVYLHITITTVTNRTIYESTSTSRPEVVSFVYGALRLEKTRNMRVVNKE